MASKQAPRSIFDVFKEKLAPTRALSYEGSNLIRLLDQEDGWSEFLKQAGPNTFNKPFSHFHKEFWDWYWRLTKMRRDKEPLTKEVLTFLAGWSRGGGKSANVEWACITEGAMGLDGYVLYVSLTQASANSHVSDIRKRLESDEIGRFFPDLAEPLIGRHANQYGWRQDFLMTKGGWAIRPVGLDVAVRGFREGDLRPTLIVFDDIDDFKMSVASVEANLETISRSILPSGTESTIHLIAQNLIAEHCAVNQIYTGKSDILGDHYPSVYPAFEELEVEKTINEKTGKPAYTIVSCKPTWEGMDIDAARINLNKTGLEAFYAEYQHDFSLDQSDKVLPEYAEEVHVISWSQFQYVFGGMYGRIPDHWQVALGLDIGYTAEHLTAWTWLTVSAEDSDMPYSYFIYRGRTFTGVSFPEQIESILEEIVTREHDGSVRDERNQYVSSKMSHEKLGERMILNRDYDFNFSAAQFGKEDGLPMWRTLLRRDMRKPHPFHVDNKTSDEKYELGRPSLYYIVDDEQLHIPRDDRGLMVHRAQVSEWRRRKTALTNSGMSDALPMKYKDDANDSTRMLFAEEILTATPLTALQRRRAALKERARTNDLTLTPGSTDYTGVLMRRQMELSEIERAERERNNQIAEHVLNIMGAPPISSRFRR